MSVDQNISTRINLMRIFLISGIVFVHVPFDPATSAYAGGQGAFDWFRVLLGDSFFRIGVPCLSAISGYLLFRRGSEAFDYPKTVRTKVETLLAPFLIWNIGLFVFVALIQSQGAGIGFFPDLWHASFRQLTSYLFSLEEFPIDLPLYFLRDLFVCILLSPILAFLVRRAPVVTCVLLFGLAILPGVTIGLVLKKSILFSFTFGIALALYKVDVKALDRHAVLGAALTVLAATLLSVGLYLTGPDYPYLLDLARNTLSIVGALGFWLLSALATPTALGQRLANTGSLSFWIFCGHYPLLLMLWMTWRRFMDNDAYPVFYFGAIVLTFFILVVSNTLISRYLPSLYQVMTGSRGRKSRSSSEGQSMRSHTHPGTQWHTHKSAVKVNR
ncbi:acyltransferase family protein [Rhizobium halophytocola]|uniref:Succinoglycan biosynthesis protein ExoH n=1 Tax=Rhizobium halophytocola TaxID=735519 RepID=A0ABS4E4W3_9HYPH|nr:acyltransferase [Rhizobium halophytocola]MBP1852953.1 succinoglycan biosynthesis protein ExoH [Rhizobium halophytocola]